MKAIDIGMIQARRAKLEADIARLREQISELEDKLAELALAERVFAELSLESNDPIPTEPDTSAEESDATGTANGADHSRKPDGIPTMPEMIIEAIKHVNSMGAPGLDPVGLRSYIRGRYWPGMPDQAVGPIAWRMAKRGDLRNMGGIYSLPTSKY